MNDSDCLAEISKSLEPRTTSKTKPQPKPQPKRDGAVDVAQALLKLPKLIEVVDALRVEQERRGDAVSMIERLELSLQQLTVKTDANLKDAGRILQRVDARLKAVDGLEAKWDLLLNRVAGVLDELERALKNI